MFISFSKENKKKFLIINKSATFNYNIYWLKVVVLISNVKGCSDSFRIRNREIGR